MKLSKRGMKIINKQRKNDLYAANYLSRLLKARLSKKEIILPNTLASDQYQIYTNQIKSFNEELKQLIQEL